MKQTERSSAYRDFRVSAYRNKYEIALQYGGKIVSYGLLLSRAEYAYNTFCQMGVLPGDRVCLWLPNCPDLLASFYGLSRLGAVATLLHPRDTAGEVRLQMERAKSERLITTPGRYDAFCREGNPLSPGQVVLCRPDRDMKGKERRIYRLSEQQKEQDPEGYFLEEMMAQNRYNSMETPFGDNGQDAVLLGGISSFLRPRFLSYLPEELAETSVEFWKKKEHIQTVFIQNSFATEGGFLAAHSALCHGKTILWSVGDPYGLLKKLRPDFLVGTEEFFWEFRQRRTTFGAQWKNLRGGVQMGRTKTELMEKFSGRAFQTVGGQGVLSSSPVPLKLWKEAVYLTQDYGVDLTHMEELFSAIPGIKKCRCYGDDGGIRVQILPDGKVSNNTLGKRVIACCKREMNRAHLPRIVEFCSIL